MRKFYRVSITILALAVTLFAGSLASGPSLSSTGQTSRASQHHGGLALTKRINSDFQAGRITFDDALIYKALAVQTPWVLPAEYQSKEMLRDSSPIVLEVLDELPNAHPEVKNFVNFIFAPPKTRKRMNKPTLFSAPLSRREIPTSSLELYLIDTDARYETPGGHFAILYATSGQHSSTLNYAQELGRYLETSWSHEISNLGFKAPGGGSDGRIDAYVVDLGTGLFGVAYPSGYLEVNKDFSWAPPNDDPAGDSTGALKVTAAHEFFHLVQYATTSFLGRAGESWWLESSATFMEDEVFDEVNDYRNYLGQFYSNTNVTIDSIDGGYETVLINKLLKEKFNGGNPAIIKEVLEELGIFTSTEEAMASVLGRRGASLASGFQQFALWNFMTGFRHRTGLYEEGATYPDFGNFQDTHSIGSSNRTTGEKSVSVDNLAANYYRILPESSLSEAKRLKIEVARSSDQIRGWVVVRLKGATAQERELVFGSDGRAKIDVDNFSAPNVDEVVIILSNGDEHFSKGAKYSAGLEQGIDIVLAIDTTGSMFDDIAAVKAAATQIVDALDAKGADYRVAVMNYEDFPVSPYGDASCGDATFHNVLSFSNSKSSIVSAIQSLSLKCGGDLPEAVLSALMHAIDAGSLGGWRKDAKKAIILMGDAPGHDPEPFTGFTTASVIAAAKGPVTSFANTQRTGKLLASMTTATVGSDDPVHIYPIAIGFDSSARTQFLALANGTEGKFFEAPMAADVVDAIIDALGTIVTPPENRPPDCNFATAEPSQLWPANHQMIPLSILGVVDADGDRVSLTITRITQDEPVLGTGSGDTSPDGFGLGMSIPSVRAERSGTGNGRMYEISFTASDGKGGQCQGKVKVSVAHDRRVNSAAVDDGQNYVSTSP